MFGKIYLMFTTMNVVQVNTVLAKKYVHKHVKIILDMPFFFKTTFIITKYGSTLYIGMDMVFQHHAHTFEKSDLNFHFQCEFSSVATER